MAAHRKTSLSAGAIIRAILLADANVKTKVNKIFPLIVDKADLPYITYRRASLEADPQKSGQPGSDTVQIEVDCYTKSYGESIELAEAVRGALDYITTEWEGMRLRSCYLSGSEEFYEDNAFVQQLIFSVKI